MLFPVVSHSPELVKKLNEEDPEPPGTPKLGIQERQEILLATLKKDGRLDKLKEWPPELAKKAVHLLLKFHQVFSLESQKFGCTDITEHVIELLDNAPFKESSLKFLPHSYYFMFKMHS